MIITGTQEQLKNELARMTLHMIKKYGEVGFSAWDEIYEKDGKYYFHSPHTNPNDERFTDFEINPELEQIEKPENWP